MLALLSDGSKATAYETVRSFWENENLAGGFESAWNRSLQNGIIAGSASPQLAAPAISDPERFRRRETLLSQMERPRPRTYNGRIIVGQGCKHP